MRQIILPAALAVMLSLSGCADSKPAVAASQAPAAFSEAAAETAPVPSPEGAEDAKAFSRPAVQHPDLSAENGRYRITLLELTADHDFKNLLFDITPLDETAGRSEYPHLVFQGNGSRPSSSGASIVRSQNGGWHYEFHCLTDSTSGHFSLIEPGQSQPSENPCSMTVDLTPNTAPPVRITEEIPINENVVMTSLTAESFCLITEYEITGYAGGSPFSLETAAGPLTVQILTAEGETLEFDLFDTLSGLSSSSTHQDSQQDPTACRHCKRLTTPFDISSAVKIQVNGRTVWENT